MKKQDITPKIINLAKRIAKYWRMEIYEGCWLFDVQNQRLTLAQISSQADAKELGFIPIPSISDCLKKLRELELRYIFHKYNLRKVSVSIIDNKARTILFQSRKNFPILHEALLNALLNVLKKGGINERKN